MKREDGTELPMRTGDLFPRFELEAYPGPEKLKDSDLRGSWVVLYFYPKDGTHGCTKEALNFRDDKERLAKIGARVVGVSTDSIPSHAKFHRKFSLNFVLLSDPRGSLGEKVGVCKGSLFKHMERVTFILDPEGKIARIYPKVKYLGHSEQVMNDLKALQLERPQQP